jgi:curved DNA-binding protein CbpA
MTDFFLLYKQPRLPWLDADVVKEKYHQLTRAAHPDVSGAHRDIEFDEVTEGFRVLSDPRLRIQHLLALQGELPDAGSRVPPADLQDLFLQVATLTQKTQGLFANMAGKSSSLVLSFMKSEIVKLRSEIEPLLGAVQRSYETSVGELRALNETWKQNSAATIPELRALHDRLSYLSRWSEQLKEMQFQLTASD